ncbi:PREDICTED: probable UDP-3-O-acylglucosamine N-acyltransferase 2, mitochondrial [Ipomoea nil]|uniref:probable UDP-3-O-acylglucosamine N-acyltransferase 2, mitochondrial n=1 Tax=Ipomoea nil TaxID=35883 RepID=UPI000901AF01|nr:PREDICTED: probable UDP-3-O-acylglucosamine N-acyltransferase 2, mitochondrial [Ipomoea nil]XP_019171545.1 PREDICTED: probable UDP-3-O-acylglucosamine N-acyltransferase 2, mitochondrial [Ipomoea nil]XP_019171546.1 PREDICTED: probable UDP-3-O-acylglucosamine N-acyltransferase 2, mitochondrial [Ipomoea nil]XP_019171547.1 PREDICTED: probable UDP-3-O-acylglucosamine N-acyltransferase 2, mitochondrial [Ipomoea nil]XP_019171548.1 PREDICTED: probable UDP-3-O-acylglucosamine N-acyltransferase 2, mit
MASRIPRLAALRSFSSISALIGCKSYRQPLFPPRSGLINSAHTHFSKNQSVYKHSSSEIDSTLKDCSEIDHEEFQKWGNGGGTFHKSSSIDPTAVIEIGAVIHAESVVAANVHVGSGSIIGPAVTIGQSTRVGYNVAVTNCTIGDFCVLHSGVCIGQDGFGFFVDEQGKMVKKPQNLNVTIGAHVEIGANTCIDRGSWRDTVIGDHSKIDNLVQIGHNVVIGKNCMLCGQVGIAGSVTIGDYVTMGGRVAIRDHVCIASKVRLAANSCVTKDINEPGDYGGFPAVPIREWRRQVATHRQSLK